MSHKPSVSIGSLSSMSTLSSIDSDASTKTHGLTSAASPSFNKAVLDIINDRTLSDDTLRARAENHLRVLTRNGFTVYNRPQWVTRIPLPIGFDEHKFNIKRLFEAMYWTASDLGLSGGARYVSAAVCACAARAMPATEDSAEPHESRLKELATQLSSLGGTWVAYMLWPFICNTRSDIVIPNEDSDAATPTHQNTALQMTGGLSNSHRERFRSQVLKRDNYTCKVTATYDRSRGLLPGHKVPPGVSYISYVEAAHIFKRSVAVFDETKIHSRSVTFDILRHYCELDESIIGNMSDLMDSPENGIVLELNAHRGFDDFQWCLQPEESINTYKIKQWSSVPVATMMNCPPSVTFTPSQDGIPPPSRTLLRLHAALTGVCHLSGAADLLILFNNPPGASGPAVRSAYGEDFEDDVLQYGGPEMSKTLALRNAVHGLVQSTANISL